MKYLEVGTIVSTHGIKGELKVKITTDDLSRFDKKEVLFVDNQGSKEKIVIDSSRLHKDMMLISFNKIQDINQCLQYVGKKIYCDADMYERNPNEYYYDDLIDCKIIVDNDCIGIVVDVMEVPQGEILRVKMNNGDNKLIPFIDEFISNVDIEDKEIKVIPIEGLL